MKTRLIILLLLLPALAGAQKKYEERYENGQLAISGFKDKKTGKPEGHWTVYAQDGKKIEECDYKDGLEEGTLYQYNTHGQVSATTEYRRGKREGSHVKYHFFPEQKDKRVVEKRCTYHDGLEEGMLYLYDTNGRLTNKRRMEKGMTVADTTYTAEGIRYQALRRVPDGSRRGYREEWDNKFVPYKTPGNATPAQPRQPERTATKGTRPAQGNKNARKNTRTKTRRATPKQQSATQKQQKLKINDNGVIDIGT